MNTPTVHIYTYDLDNGQVRARAGGLRDTVGHRRYLLAWCGRVAPERLTP